MKMRLAIGLGLATAVALMTVSWPWLTRVMGRPRPRFPYLATPLSSTAYDELAHLEGWAKSLITVAPGVKLRGLVRNPKNPGSPWVLYYPGNDRTQLRTGQAFLATLFGTDDLGLAVFAYRGFDGFRRKTGVCGARPRCTVDSRLLMPAATHPTSPSTCRRVLDRWTLFDHCRTFGQHRWHADKNAQSSG